MINEMINVKNFSAKKLDFPPESGHDDFVGFAMHQVSYLSDLSGFIAMFVLLFFMLHVFSNTSAVLYDKPNCSVLLGQLLRLL